ncbi:unnamed protein product [Cutaneotrichosporon oleaginosum]
MTRRPLPPCRPGFKDHIYKVTHSVELPIRVWPPLKRKRDGSVPWLLWIHGAWVTRAFGEHGYAIASVGYRQQPHASMADMLGDCLAAAAWCRAHLPRLVGADADAWVVGGSSGGASLACLVAHAPLHAAALPPPRVLVDVYGAPNAADDYHHNPYRKVAVEEYYVADDAELADALADRDPRNAVTQSPWAYEMPPAVPLAECRAALGVPDFTPARHHFARNDLWSYVAKHRLLMPTVFRREEHTPRTYWAHVTAHSAYHLLDRAETYPATFILHGTADVDVRIQQSWEFADKLRRKGVPVAEVYPEGKGHMFDFELVTPEDEGWDECIEACLDFVDEHIGVGGGEGSGDRGGGGRESTALLN